jgi:ferredoxin-NADP reductase
MMPYTVKNWRNCKAGCPDSIIYLYSPARLRRRMSTIRRLVQMRKDTNSGSHRTGYVHAVYEEICKWEKNGSADSDKPALKPASFYLCGWKNMIDEAKKRIQELGYDRKAIHQELYG